MRRCPLSSGGSTRRGIVPPRCDVRTPRFTRLGRTAARPFAWVHGGAPRSRPHPLLPAARPVRASSRPTRCWGRALPPCRGGLGVRPSSRIATRCITSAACGSFCKKKPILRRQKSRTERLAGAGLHRWSAMAARRLSRGNSPFSCRKSASVRSWSSCSVGLNMLLPFQRRAGARSTLRTAVGRRAASDK